MHGCVPVRDTHIIIYTHIKRQLKCYNIYFTNLSVLPIGIHTHSGRVSSSWNVKHQTWPTGSVISVFYRWHNQYNMQSIYLYIHNTEPLVGSDSMRNLFSYDRFLFSFHFVTFFFLNLIVFEKLSIDFCPESEFSYMDQPIKSNVSRTCSMPEVLDTNIL